ncbi:hypothetical protein Tco_0054916 [Tanacetum coccineum]
MHPNLYNSPNAPFTGGDGVVYHDGCHGGGDDDDGDEGGEGDMMMMVVRWASVGGRRWMAESLAGSGDGTGKGERGG